MSIQRYRFDGVDLVKDEGGRWVKHDDRLAEVEKLQRLVRYHQEGWEKARSAFERVALESLDCTEENDRLKVRIAQLEGRHGPLTQAIATMRKGFGLPGEPDDARPDFYDQDTD